MRTRAVGLLIFGAAMLLPSLAQAQLLPRLPIRRERVPCVQENPQYRQIRQDYWGYYPTCWRKFPPGWGCPSPEAPDFNRSKQELPLVRPEGLDPIDEDKTDLQGNRVPRGNGRRDPVTDPQPLPALPSNDNLFDQDLKPDAPANVRPNPNNPNPNPNPRPAGGLDDVPLGGAAAPTPPPATSAAPTRRTSLVAGLFGSRTR